MGSLRLEPRPALTLPWNLTPELERILRDREGERARMVDEQIRRRGISDARVLEAFRLVPRELFVPRDMATYAYDDTPLPIGEGQTISQPYIVARTLEALAPQPSDRVLEIGAGSGYAAALLRVLADRVDTVERLVGLASAARARFAALGLDVAVHLGDGTLGLPERAPYDVIAVAAGGPRIPDALVAQLAPHGRLVIPVRVDGHQELVRVVRSPEGALHRQSLESVKFVPLIGAQGERDETRGRTDVGRAD